MEIVRVLTLTCKVAERVGNPVVGVARLESPGRLQAGAETIVVQPRFAAEEPQLQA